MGDGGHGVVVWSGGGKMGKRKWKNEKKIMRAKNGEKKMKKEDGSRKCGRRRGGLQLCVGGRGEKKMEKS